MRGRRALEQMHQRRQKSQRRDHARRHPGRHHEPQTGNPPMVRQHQAAKTRNRRQPGHEHRFASALGENPDCVPAKRLRM